MKKLILPFLSALSLITLLFTGCLGVFRVVEVAQVKVKSFDLRDFTNVEFSDAIEYELKQSDSYSVVASAPENMIELLDIHQTGNTLYVGRKNHLSPLTYSDIRVVVAMPQLNKLAVSGACKGKASGFDSSGGLDINVAGASELDMNLSGGKTGFDISGASKITGNLTSTDTQIKLNGSSKLNMTLKTGKTRIDASGSSEVRGDLQATDSQFILSGASECVFTGSAGNTLIEASGSSKMNSPGLALESADVKLGGASYASIHTDGTLNIDLNGASTLDYSGNPPIGKLDISGASRMNHK